jgi:hypothetical protein
LHSSDVQPGVGWAPCVATALLLLLSNALADSAIATDVTKAAGTIRRSRIAVSLSERASIIEETITLRFLEVENLLFILI